MLVTKMQKNALIIGLVCFGLAAIFGYATARLTIFEQNGITTTEDSQVSFQKAFNYNFSLTTGQTLIIKFSVHYNNITANLKVFGKGTFEQEYVKNTTNAPQNVAGRNFLQANPGWVSTATPTAGTLSATATCTTDGYYFLEFMGNGGGSRIWTEPGDYVILVYGSNAGGDSTQTDVKFNLSISIDGPGPILSTLLNITGLVILGALALSLILNFRKNLLE